MKHTVEFELRKKIIIMVDAQDEQDAEDIVAEMIDTGRIYKCDEFRNSFETDYDIMLTVEEE